MLISYFVSETYNTKETERKQNEIKNGPTLTVQTKTTCNERINTPETAKSPHISFQHKSSIHTNTTHSSNTNALPIFTESNMADATNSNSFDCRTISSAKTQPDNGPVTSKGTSIQSPSEGNSRTATGGKNTSIDMCNENSSADSRMEVEESQIDGHNLAQEGEVMVDAPDHSNANTSEQRDGVSPIAKDTAMEVRVWNV